MTTEMRRVRRWAAWSYVFGGPVMAAVVFVGTTWPSRP